MIGRRRSRSVFGAVALCLFAALVPTSALSAPTVPCKDAALAFLSGKQDKQMETVQLRTFHIEAKPLAKGYKIGRAAKVSVQITRPADEDPTGSGIPLPAGPLSSPAPDVFVGVGVNVGDVFLPGFAVTDEQGKAVVKVELKSYTVPGSADVSVYAYQTTANTTCLRVEENGFRQYPKMFSIKN
ncbi:MAG: hypothetical protein QOH26_99 [Actinomycetota bacterium]|nr:hypothetical protein [Actinomycetota bacterium]